MEEEEEEEEEEGPFEEEKQEAPHVPSIEELGTLKVKELQKELKDRGFPPKETKKRKAQLIAMLHQWYKDAAATAVAEQTAAKGPAATQAPDGDDQQMELEPPEPAPVERAGAESLREDAAAHEAAEQAAAAEAAEAAEAEAAAHKAAEEDAACKAAEERAVAAAAEAAEAEAAAAAEAEAARLLEEEKTRNEEEQAELQRQQKEEAAAAEEEREAALLAAKAAAAQPPVAPAPCPVRTPVVASSPCPVRILPGTTSGYTMTPDKASDDDDAESDDEGKATTVNGKLIPRWAQKDQLASIQEFRDPDAVFGLVETCDISGKFDAIDVHG